MKPRKVGGSTSGGAVGLIAGVATSFLLFAWFFLVPTQHDPDWWRHVGFPWNKNAPSTVLDTPMQSAAARAKAEHTIKNIKNGRDYFSDFDISTIDVDLNDAEPTHFHYIDPRTSPVPVAYLSAKPKVLLVPEFLTDEECDGLIDLARPSMSRSHVVPYLDAKDKNPAQEVRTSTQTWLGLHSNPTRQVVQRILNLTGLPFSSAEPMQILRYNVGQKYDAHHDYLHPDLYGKQTRSRAVTVFLYLNDTPRGGETQFPRANGKGPTSDFVTCNRGLRVRPKKRALAIFYDMKPNGEYDEHSLHGGCPVIEGVKWGGTLWLSIPV